MIATGPRIDPHKLYTQEELKALLPASLLRLIIRQAATIDDLYSGRQVGSLVEDVFKETPRWEQRSPSTTSAVKTTYLTVTQVAEILNSSPREVTRLVDSGKLRAIDLNEGQGKKKRQLRFRLEWVEELDARLALRAIELPKAKFRIPASRSSQKP